MPARNYADRYSLACHRLVEVDGKMIPLIAISTVASEHAMNEGHLVIWKDQKQVVDFVRLVMGEAREGTQISLPELWDQFTTSRLAA